MSPRYAPLAPAHACCAEPSARAGVSQWFFTVVPTISAPQGAAVVSVYKCGRVGGFVDANHRAVRTLVRLRSFNFSSNTATRLSTTELKNDFSFLVARARGSGSTQPG